MQLWKRITKIFAIDTCVPFLLLVLVVIPTMTIVVAIAGGGGDTDNETSLDIWTSVKDEVKFGEAIENDISGILLSYTFSLENGHIEEDDREKIKDYITDSMCISDQGINRFFTLQEVLEKVKSILSDDDSYFEFVQILKANFLFEPQQEGKYPYPLE